MKIEFPSEKVIEDYIYSELNAGGPCPISGEYPDRTYRQHEIKGYGITDIIKVRVSDKAAFVTVLELKNEALKASHVEQLCRYLVGINRIADRYRKRGFRVNVNGQLAGPFVSSDIVYLIQWMHPAISLFDLSLTMQSGLSVRAISRQWFCVDEKLQVDREISRDLYGMYQDEKGMAEDQAEAEAEHKRMLHAVK